MSYQGSTTNSNEIIEEEDNISQAQRSVSQAQQHQYQSNNPLNPPPPPTPLPRSHSTQEFTALTTKETDHVTLFVAYDGEWEYDSKELIFNNSKGSMFVVPKHIRLSEMSEILYDRFCVNRLLYRLKLEVHRTGSPWFPLIEIQNNQDLSVFISETLKKELTLCVTRLKKDEIDVYEEKRKDNVTLFVAYNGKWEYEGKERFFKNSSGSQLVVSKNIKLSEITDILNRKFYVDKDSDRLILEVHYGTNGSPWFPVTRIHNDQDLSVFISETSKTRLPLCVTELKDVSRKRVAEERAKDETVEKRLMKAIMRYDWVKAREIIVNNTEKVTWTSELDEGKTAFHFAVGEFKDNEVVRDIVNALQLNSELLVTTVDDDGFIPTHYAAAYGNKEALQIMLDSNPKCLFIPGKYDDDLAINCALEIPEIETFRYLFKKMQSYKDEFDTFLKGEVALKLLGQVIDTGLIVVAYELINDYPSIATQVYDEITPLERIIRKADLFYSGTHYNLYQRFVYQYVPIENNSLGDTDMANIENDNLGGTDMADIQNNSLGGTDMADIQNNSFGSTNMADEENQETPKKDKFVTKHKRRWLYDVMWRTIWVKLWKTTLLHLPHAKRLKDDKVNHNTTIKLLEHICEKLDRKHTSSDIGRLYSSSFCLAVENNTDEAIAVLTTYFPYALSTTGDWEKILGLTVLNHSQKVYSFIANLRRTAKYAVLLDKDHDDNNILHLAGRLAPIQKLNAASGAALQMQQELQWFEEVRKTVPLALTRALNKNKETPMMVFRKEHKELRKDGEEWMKKTADSYTITAALIITIVFAAAITVPGGNNSSTGKPIYGTKSSLIIFAISDAISLFTSTTSLLLFLSILTARYADEDFLYKLPKRLISGLVMLFMSVTSMMIAFGATLYIMFGQEKQWILIPIGALACLPIASFMKLQFPLLVELISSTYGHGMFGKEKDYKKSRANGNKKKRA